MSYNTEQFYNIVSSGVVTNRSELNADSYSNPPFMWPGPTRKHSENGKWVDKGNIQRGFIRMLTQSKGESASEEMSKRRCFFQFNPQTIVREVSMRSDMMNPLLQSPAEFSVPTPGNSSFGFELMFDRSFELNNPEPSSSTNGFGNGPGGTDINLGTNTWGTEDPFLIASANKVGVLADLRVLDTIIGQGFTKDMMDYIIERGKIESSLKTADTSVSVSTPSSTEGSDSTTESTTTSYSSSDDSATAWDADTVREAFNKNVGNQAFLIPTPVRVVFSSLFMVDGFVTGVTVSFVKFNEAMVPMQCAIGIQMQALYIGFAKKDTYLTWALSQAEPKELPTSDSPTIVDQAGFDALKAKVLGTSSLAGDGLLKRFKAVPFNHLSGETWDNTALIKYAGLTGAIDFSSDSYANSSQGDSVYNYLPGMAEKRTLRWTYGFEQPETFTEDPIYDLFLRGEITRFSYSMDISINRPLGLSTAEKVPTISQDLKDQGNINVMYFRTEHNMVSDSEWTKFRRVNGRKENEGSLLTNEAHIDDLRSRLLNITPYGGSSENQLKFQWNENIDTWISSNKFTVTLFLKGEVEDTAGNIVKFWGRDQKLVSKLEPFALYAKPYESEELARAFTISPTTPPLRLS